MSGKTSSQLLAHCADASAGSCRCRHHKWEVKQTIAGALCRCQCCGVPLPTPQVGIINYWCTVSLPVRSRADAGATSGETRNQSVTSALCRCECWVVPLPTLQVSIGYASNQSLVHCAVASAGSCRCRRHKCEIKQTIVGALCRCQCDVVPLPTPQVGRLAIGALCRCQCGVVPMPTPQVGRQAVNDQLLEHCVDASAESCRW